MSDENNVCVVACKLSPLRPDLEVEHKRFMGSWVLRDIFLRHYLLRTLDQGRGSKQAVHCGERPCGVGNPVSIFTPQALRFSCIMAREISNGPRVMVPIVE